MCWEWCPNLSWLFDLSPGPACFDVPSTVSTFPDRRCSGGTLIAFPAEGEVDLSSCMTIRQRLCEEVKHNRGTLETSEDERDGRSLDDGACFLGVEFLLDSATVGVGAGCELSLGG